MLLTSGSQASLLCQTLECRLSKSVLNGLSAVIFRWHSFVCLLIVIHSCKILSHYPKIPTVEIMCDGDTVIKLFRIHIFIGQRQYRNSCDSLRDSHSGNRAVSSPSQSALCVQFFWNHNIFYFIICLVQRRKDFSHRGNSWFMVWPFSLYVFV